MLRLLVTCAPWALTQSWGLRGTRRSLRSQQQKDLPASVLSAIQEYTEACKSPKATPTCVPFGISNQAREVLPATLPASAMSGSTWTGKPEALNLQSKKWTVYLPRAGFFGLCCFRKLNEGKHYRIHIQEGKVESSVFTEGLFGFF